ncbi:hypothetical protein ACQYAD_02975 [Neobacillus sp. SM06]|uniref:hypothetical protein n=1 Tax=Neobacillus sp. SM06 TaxID=3422492 RepID=UPI003D2DB901
MITPENKLLLFDLLYRHYILHEDLDRIHQLIATLKKEMTTIEAEDVTALDPNQFPAKLKSEWQEYLDCRKKQKM